MKPFALLLTFTLSVTAVGCSKGGSKASAPHRQAPDLIVAYGCQTCHVIPGVPGAVGKVGPSLDALGQRSYLAGTIPNSPANLQRWIMHPQALQPGTAMPEMGVTPDDAREIAAFLQTAD